MNRNTITYSMALLLLMSFSGVSFAGGSNVTGGGDYRETWV